MSRARGAVAMGISGALLEEVDYDENGQNRSGSFADYLLATAVEIPPIEVISQPTPNRKTPTGSKGMSEGGIMGATGVLPSGSIAALDADIVSALGSTVDGETGLRVLFDSSSGRRRWLPRIAANDH